MMVEGFDAADPSRAERGAPGSSRNGAPARSWERSFSSLGGYSALLDSLARADVRCKSVVRRYAWQRGSVDVRGERLGTQFRYSRPKAIVTLRSACCNRTQSALSPR